jgi:hypothetical protein
VSGSSTVTLTHRRRRARHTLHRHRNDAIRATADQRARANLWRDWGAQATTVFADDPVPLSEEATLLELAGGLTAKLNTRLSVFAQAGFQFAVLQGGENTVRNGVKGDFGVRYAW